MNEKIGNLLIMCVCFGVGASVLLITNWQEPEVRIPTGDYQSFSWDWRVEDTEKWTTSVNSGSKTTAKLIESKRWGDSKKDRGIEIKAKSWLQSVLVRWFPEDSLANQIATYAYKISNGDMDFLMTLKAENWWFDMYKQSNVVKNWVREDSWGLCQLNRRRHKEVDTKEFRESWKYQVDVCYKKWKGWTIFYWKLVKDKYKNDFTIIN